MPYEALERLDMVTDQLFADKMHQVVTIRCTSSVGTLWLAPQIGAFKVSHPEIDLHIRTLDSEVETSVDTGADLEIFVSGTASHDTQVQPLLSATITPVAAPGYLAHHRPVRPEEILNFNLIHILGYEDDWNRWFQHFGLNTQDVPHGLVVDASLIAIDAALRWDGVFLGRRPFIDAYLNSGDLVEVFADPYHLHASYFLRRRIGAKNARNRDRVAAWLINLPGATNGPRSPALHL